MRGISGILSFDFFSQDMEKKKEIAGQFFQGRSYSEICENSDISVLLDVQSLDKLDKQPIKSQDGRFVIVFDGAIYNRKELKEGFVEKYEFQTESDAELVLHLFEEFGPKALNDLNGKFAIAIWDKNERMLFLARDRMGEKPLYYASFNKQFYFASKLNDLAEIPGFTKEVSKASVHKFLTYGYIPAPDTIWKDVWSLSPGQYIRVCENGKIKKTRYWDLDFSQKTDLSYEESKNHLRELITDALELRMKTDLPKGAFLSGGIDSSIVVGLMASLKSDSLKTFTLGFTEEKFSETSYARLMAEKFKTDHHEIKLNPDYKKELFDIVRAYGQPFGDSSALPTYFISKEAARHVKFILTGDGADESFGGYSRYSSFFKIKKTLKKYGPLLKLADKLGFLTKFADKYLFRGKLSKAIALSKSSLSEVYLVSHRIFDEKLKEKIYSPQMYQEFGKIDAGDVLKKYFDKEGLPSNADRMFYSDVNLYLSEDIIVKIGISSGANLLEVSSPFLDYRLVEFAASLPSEWKIKGEDKKVILKETFSDLLPEKIVNRKKMGFGIPIDSWFRNQWKDYFYETVFSEQALSRGYFIQEGLEEIFTEHITGKKDHGYRMWNLLVLEIWHKIFVDS